MRRNSSAVNVTLDEHGWADVESLIQSVCATGRRFDLATLKDIVATDSKQRFAFNDNHTKIRANQGHSVALDVEMTECEPPAELYHGTVEKYIDSIYAEGITKRSRNYVYLSIDVETALKVGSRHGKAVFWLLMRNKCTTTDINSCCLQMVCGRRNLFRINM